MKQYLKVILGVMIVIGGILMANFNADGSEYAKYSSEDSEINITMDYVTDWRLSEHRGSYGSYAQVQFLKVVKSGFAPSIIVTVERSEKVSFKPLTVQGLADDLIRKRMMFKDAEVLLRTDRSLLDLPAIDITLTYKQLDKLLNVDAKLIPFKERIIVIQKDDRFYTIRYVNPEKEYNVFEKDFLHCIETLKLKD